MSARRGTMPLERLRWQTWLMVAAVLALAVTTALLVIVERGQ